MKIGLPLDILSLLPTGQGHKQGENGKGFLALLQDKPENEPSSPLLAADAAAQSTARSDWETSHQLLGANEFLPAIEVRQDEKIEQAPLLSFETQTPDTFDAQFNLLHAAEPLLASTASLTAQNSRSPASLQLIDHLIDPHVQLAFATNKLSYKQNGAVHSQPQQSLGHHHVEPEKIQSQRPILSEATAALIKQNEASAKTYSVNGQDEKAESQLTPSKVQLAKAQQLLSELSPYLKKHVLVVKSDDQFVIYVRDYQQGEAQLESELQQLGANLSMQSGKPVQFVINGKSQTQHDLNTTRGSHHAR